MKKWLLDEVKKNGAHSNHSKGRSRSSLSFENAIARHAGDQTTTSLIKDETSGP